MIGNTGDLVKDKFGGSLQQLLSEHPNTRIPEYPPFAIALSGGSDSLALLHLALQALGKERITALTVDHALRPESGAEAKRVARWMGELGIAHHILTWQHQGEMKNLQAAARSARYQLMSDWCHRHDVPILLIGHTQDDQAETIAMRQMRGAGSIGLAGMSARRELDGVTLLRPLLAHDRQELREWLQSQKIEWIDDPSNENEDFLRIQIRKELAKNPEQKQELLALGQRMVVERMAIEKTHAAFIAQHMMRNSRAGGSPAKQELDPRLRGDYVSLVSSPFLKLEEAQAAYTLGCILQHIGGQDYAPRYAKLQRCLQHFRQANPLRYSLGNCLIEQRNEQLIFTREKELSPFTPKPLVPSAFVPIFT